MSGAGVLAATERFVSPSGGHVEPFTAWAGAATNIQAAIDVSADGDVIWVTNGVYNTGGKVMAGDLTNRVALTKALTVQSVNGPFVTTIQGNGATNGPNAVRCAWLTNGAVLNGFTLRDGATRTGSSAIEIAYGGGALCASTNAIIGNSIFLTNTAYSQAPAAYRGFLKNCLVKGNASGSGVGACLNSSALNNCTVLSNLCYGVQSCTLTNCVVYYNTLGGMQANYQSGTFAYSCTAPLPAGAGNFSAAPQLVPDGIHLGNSSPCRGAGTNLVSGTDIDSQPWSNPPSVGCDEWQSAPLVLTPTIQLTNARPGFLLSVTVAGEPPFVCWWFRNGVVVEEDGHFSSSNGTNLVATGVDLLDGGSYQVVVSNAFGMSTSAVAQLVVHYVDAAASAPAWPYTNWQTAASNIQDAIDAASAGEIILVTNGLYATGGKVTTGDLTNRVALTKPVLVQSVNGPEVTTIQGAWNPGTTNGPLAVRCAWVTNWATLSGFTLRDGATRAAGAATTEQQGGGVWGASTNATAHNCVIQGNAAAAGAAGACTVTLRNCTLTGNFAYTYGGGAGKCNLWNCILTENRCTSDGGGAYFSNLKNCALLGNYALGSGGGANRGTLVNCTVMSNSVGTSSSGNGGGVVSANLTNSIIYANRNLNTYYSDSNCASCTLSYSCSAPLVAGIGNISADPQMLSDGLHLLAGSPCRGAGLGAVVAGTDIDGQSWAEPPSMGCDEWSATPIVPNQPAVQLSGRPPKLQVSLPAGGQEPLFLSWLKEGSPLAENGHFESVNSRTLTVNGFGPEDAGNYQMVASNAFGVFTSAVVRVVVHCANVASTAPQPPYSTWGTGATNLQDAIDAAERGEFVLVTNGVYATGGRVAAGSLLSRVALTRSISVTSMSGPEATVIQGAWDPSTTNGPLAVRCAWVGASSRLDGFTLRGGATRTTGDLGADMGGGGVFGASVTAEVVNCIIASNSAAYGGGCYQSTVTCCRITDNSSFVNGGGVYGGTLRSCLIRRNVTAGGGGGAYGGTLVNCTITENKSLFPGGGVYVVSWVRNCIILANSYGTLPDYSTFANFAGSANGLITYSCTYPSAAGVGNISANSELLDEYHIASTSLCRASGSILYCSGTDLDGEPWANPPSMGCDEVWEDAIRGPLRVASIATSLPVGVARKSQFVHAHIEGRATRVEWSFGDGAVLTNASLLALSHTWTNAGDYTLTFTAYNADHPSGVSTNLVFHVDPVLEPVIRIGYYTGTNFIFTFPTQYGVTYYFERTTNLAPPTAWETIASAHSWASSMQVTDTRATNAANFYRVRAAVTLP